MKIVTKQYAITEKGEAKYLIYLQTDDDINVEVYDVTGELNRIIKENELLEDHSPTSFKFIDYNTYRIQNGILSEQYPIILCFYLDREFLMNSEIFEAYYRGINHVITAKNANILAFFMPCDGSNERIECINPIYVSEQDMEKINTIIKHLTKQFQIGDN